MLVGLLRHGVAQDEHPSGDAARDLTDRGRDRMTRAARGIARLDHGFEVIVTSPFTRCLHTAQICATQLEIPVVPDERVQPGFEVGPLIDILIEHSFREAVLVCGHQPDLSEITYDLVRGGIAEFRKGSLAIIRFDDAPRIGAGVLAALYPPSALRQLAGQRTGR